MPDIIPFPRPKRRTPTEENDRANQLLKQFVDTWKIKNSNDRVNAFYHLRTDIFDYVFLVMDKPKILGDN